MARPLPIYGDGCNVRDWLHVTDHCTAIDSVLHHGQTGETYNIGGNNELRNIDLVHELCAICDQLFAANESIRARFPDAPGARGRSAAELIILRRGPAGHDRRYAIDSSKIQRELGYQPGISIDAGLRATLGWYLDNESWWRAILDGRDRLRRRQSQWAAQLTMPAAAPAQRPYLVFIRCGSQSLHQRLLAEEPARRWDCCVSWYCPPVDEQLADYYSSGGDNKLEGFLRFREQYSNLPSYRYVLLLDDDVNFKPGDISRFLEICDRHSTFLAQPSLRWDTNYNLRVTLHNPACELRHVSFVEVMAPCFRAETL